MASKNESTLQESLILEEEPEIIEKCSESDEESEERELLKLKKEIK